MTTFFHLFYKLTPIFLFVYVIITSLNLAPISGASNGHSLGNETDHDALLAIKSQLVGDPSLVLSSWNNSLHHCNWYGVICGRKHKRVVVLDLSSSELVGTISPFIGNLSFVRVVEFFNNSIVGRIPPELGRLSRLQVLRLYNNTLRGEIPSNLSACTNLEMLSLANNKLQGTLPFELSALSKLRSLSIYANRLTGPLSEVIRNVTSLEIINVVNNAFTGNIPTSIGRMQNLKTLLAGDNRFSGTIPSSILNCSVLESLDISMNKLQGELPPNIGFTIPHLVYLDLSINQFSGKFPYSILNLTGATLLSLGSNNFTGRIPSDFGGLYNLRFLNLNLNHLEGDISFLRSLVNCSELTYMEVSGNKFTGKLPEIVSNFSTSLRTFLIEYNEIAGEIPVGVFDLINLELIALNNNELTGPIPNEIRKLHNLERLYLESNKLEGNIPDSFRNLSHLSVVHLSDNRFQGRVPPSLGSCLNLLNLDLSSNHLNGTLVKELFEGPAMFTSLLLRDNLLEGFIPQEIITQINLGNLSLARNKLSGIIPDGLGQCRRLVSLDMQGNFLTGSIPSSLSSLGSLQIVDLSQNNLSGTIPNYFSKFPLELLNLSYNNFEGEVPMTGVFSNISAMELDGNVKLCGGISKLHLPKCKIHKEKRKIRKLPLAFKVTIPILCALAGVLIVAIWLCLTYQKKRRVPISSGSTSETFIKVSYDKILKATEGLSLDNLVGAGNFGSVFRGNLDGKVVAIKVLNLQTRGASKSFIAECNALRNVRHRNLVGIVTVCSSIDFKGNDFRALVYEFMPNGNLDRWLHGDGAEKLSLAQRVDIVIDVAQAIIYLHHDCETPIVHCDLKPSNVLLDNDIVARVGDFGLAKFVSQPRHQNQSSSIGILGTVGYVAPEYGLGNESSADGDIYSYGILVLELVTGRRPTDKMFHEGYSLQLYAEEALSSNVLQIVDPKIRVDDEIDEDVDDTRTIETIIQRRFECIVSMITIGIACSKHVPKDRMKISDAVSKLQGSRDNLCNARHRRNFRKVVNDPSSGKHERNLSDSG